jgi:hypothetical protein
MDCEARGNGPVEDPKAAFLHPEAYKAYQDANVEYRTATARVYEKICINSGKRSVVQQVELYRLYRLKSDFGIGDGKPADNPGHSVHEYGIAIDIIRASDEARLKTALENNGWKQHASSEEQHHYTATGIPSWNTINSKRDAVLAAHIGLKDKIVQRIQLQLDTNGAEKKVAEARQKVGYARQDVAAHRQIYNMNAGLLDSEKNSLSLAEQRRDSLQLALASAKSDLAGFVYTYCPNRQPYDQCNHEDLKARYREERQAKADNVSHLQNDLSQITNRISGSERRLAQLQQRLDVAQAELVVSQQREAVAESALQKTITDLSTLRRDASELDRDIGAEAQVIQAEVDAFLGGA